MNPDQYTLGEHFIEVGNGHTLYLQDWGNAKAKPIIYLHGGPGGSVSDDHKGYFNPKLQRVIFFDQRGSGRSLPSGSTQHNTTAHLVDDIENIIKYLKLKKVIVTGGSWGACLALAYAIKYPHRVEAMVLRGIFTGGREETEYCDTAAQLFFPEAWDTFLSRTPKSHHRDPTTYHFKQMTSDDPDKLAKSAYAYSELESALIKLDDRRVPEDPNDFDPSGMTIELHYLATNCFLPNNYIIDNAHKLKMPIWLIQGRYDVVCPPITAFKLHQKLPQGHLIWTVAGHSGNDRANYDAVRALLEQLASQ